MTDLSPTSYRFVFLESSEQGNEVVHIRNDRTGRYVDEDDSGLNVDTSLNTEVDKQWELISTANGEILIRNCDSGAYLHEAANHNVNTTNQLGPDCHWTVVEPAGWYATELARQFPTRIDL